MYLLGYDIGSSSIKAALVDASKGNTIAVCQYPDKEMDMLSLKAGWAEQDPDSWWSSIKEVTRKLLSESSVSPKEIWAIGIAYQMHGLVAIDKNHRPLRPEIIWCDSRAVNIGKSAYEEIGEVHCLNTLLNSPGNFTASKLKWVKENEPHLYEQIDKILLPGDYIALKMTGRACTTISGLSEGMFWDFKEEAVAQFLLDHYEIDDSLIPELVDTFSPQGELTNEAAEYLGLASGIPVGYRAGDQPNNALSLNVFKPGDVAATGGTSGVIYGVVDEPLFDLKTRVNAFAHVNHSKENPRIGVLLCINGAGIQYNWMRQMLAEEETTYDDIEKEAANVSIGSEGLKIFPFGNGAERMLENRPSDAVIKGLQFNRHDKCHLYRAALEGIAFSFIYGAEIMKQMGMEVRSLKVGNDNLFQSQIFSDTIASVMDCEIEMQDTTGAVGAAKAAGVGSGIYPTMQAAFDKNELVKSYKPNGSQQAFQEAYQSWKNELEHTISA